MNQFRGVKLLELASVLAGPLCGSFFAELGATVTKVENKGSGDITRSWKIKGEREEGPSAYYASANYGKQVLRLDLTDPKDLDECRELIRVTDIIITNFKPGDDKKFGLTSDAIRAIKPDILQGNIRGFPTGDDRPAFDLVLQAESGFLSMTGWPGQAPAKMPVALIDVLAAHQLKEGLLLAWIDKLQSNTSAFVEVSLFETAISALVNQASNYLMENAVAQPLGTLHPNIAPYGELLHSQDDHMLVLAIGNDHQFNNLCQVLDLNELPANSSFSSNNKRVENRGELQKILESASQKRKADSLYLELVKKGVPVGRIRPLNEVLDDPASQALILKDRLEGKALARPKGFVAHITTFPKQP